MRFKTLFLIMVLCFVPASMYAGSACATPTVVPADGRLVDFDFVAASGTNFYQFNGTIGHSYSVEVRQDYDDLQTTNDLTTTVDSDASCTTPVATTDTTASEPALPANSFRGSFTAAATGTFKIKVVNGNGTTGRYVSVSVSDTTTYNPRWSTFAGFVTQYNFVNTTSNQTINGKLTVTPSTAFPSLSPKTISFTISPGTNVFQIVGVSGNPSATVSFASAAVGTATFTHDGPPNSVQVDCFFLNGNATVVVPAKFEPIRQGR